MEELAKRLKAERLKRGLTLQEVSAKSRINPTVLGKLEGCRFGEIGAPFIVEGLLRAYADALGVDAGPAAEEVRQDRAPDAERPERPGRGARNAVLAVCFMTALLVAALVWRVPPIHDDHGKVRPKEPERPAVTQPFAGPAVKEEAAAPSAEPPAPQKMETPPAASGQESGKGEPQAASPPEGNVSARPVSPSSEQSAAALPPASTGESQPEPNATPEPAPPVAPAAPTAVAPSGQHAGAVSPEPSSPAQNLAALPPPSAPGPEAPVPGTSEKIEPPPPCPPPPSRPEFHHLEIQADQKTWIQVKVDDSKPESELLQPGDVRRWQAREKVALTVGNGGGVRMKWDGSPVEITRKQGRVVRLTLPPKQAAP